MAFFKLGSVFLGLMFCLGGNAFAFGGKQPVDAMPSGMRQVLEQLKLDAYGTALNREFSSNTPPLVQVTAGKAFLFDDSALVGKNFECRSFLVASQSNALPAVTKVSYDFRTAGNLFRENVATDAQVKLFTILSDVDAPNDLMKADVIGQNDARNYYEKIRMTSSGDLIIEGSTPAQFWAQTAQSLLGIQFPDFLRYQKEIDQELDRLKLKVNLYGTAGMVLKYTYCPRDPAALQSLDRGLQQAGLSIE